MTPRLKSLIGGLVLLAAAIGFSTAATAQEAPSSGFNEVNELVNRAFFEYDPTFYENRSRGRQLDFIIGPYAENEIANSAELVNIIIRDLLTEQIATDPYLRTPDLPNPYETSLLLSPRFNAQESFGTEFRIETPPPLTP